MRFRMQCPNCEQTLFVRDEEQGHKGRCPKCKQEMMLVRPSPPAAAKPAAPTAPRRRTPPAAPRPAQAENDDDLAVAVVLDDEAPATVNLQAPGLAPAGARGASQELALGHLDAETAHDSFGVKGAIPVGRIGQAPLGKPRNPALVFLLSLVPFYAVYWFVVTRGELLSHQQRPPETTGRFIWRLVRFCLLGLPGGIYPFIYCSYLVPTRIAAIQAKCGEPNRISPNACLALAFLPVLLIAGLIVNMVMQFLPLTGSLALVNWIALIVLLLLAFALPILKMQQALTGHWAWHTRRGNTSVTQGLLR